MAGHVDTLTAVVSHRLRQINLIRHIFVTTEHKIGTPNWASLLLHKSNCTRCLLFIGSHVTLGITNRKVATPADEVLTVLHSS